jgi:hypothetical protein
MNTDPDMSVSGSELEKSKFFDAFKKKKKRRSN